MVSTVARDASAIRLADGAEILHSVAAGFCSVCGAVWPCSNARRRAGNDPQLGTAVGLGYLHLDRAVEPRSTPTGAVSQLERFAVTCGYSLGEIFVDDDPLRLLGWASLLQSVTVSRPIAVLVPDLPAWRPPDATLRVMRARLARITSAPLVLAACPPRFGSHRDERG